MALEEFLGENLRPLQPGRRARRAEDPPAICLEAVHDPGRQRVVGADDGQVHPLRRREREQALHVGDGQRDVLAEPAVPALPGAQ